MVQSLVRDGCPGTRTRPALSSRRRDPAGPPGCPATFRTRLPGRPVGADLAFDSDVLPVPVPRHALRRDDIPFEPCSVHVGALDAQPRSVGLADMVAHPDPGILHSVTIKHVIASFVVRIWVRRVVARGFRGRAILVAEFRCRQRSHVSCRPAHFSGAVGEASGHSVERGPSPGVQRLRLAPDPDPGHACSDERKAGEAMAGRVLMARALAARWPVRTREQAARTFLHNTISAYWEQVHAEGPGWWALPQPSTSVTPCTTWVSRLSFRESSSRATKLPHPKSSRALANARKCGMHALGCRAHAADRAIAHGEGAGRPAVESERVLIACEHVVADGT